MVHGYTENGYGVIGFLSTIAVLENDTLITALKTPLGLVVSGIKLENNTLYLHMVNDWLYNTRPTTILCNIDIAANNTHWCMKIHDLRLDTMAVADNTIYLAGITNINFNKYLILAQLDKNTGTIIHAYRYRIEYSIRTYSLKLINNTLYLTGRTRDGFYIVEFNSSHDIVGSTEIVPAYPAAGSIAYRGNKLYIVGTIFNNTLRRPFIIDVGRGIGRAYLYSGAPNGTIGITIYMLDGDPVAVFKASIYYRTIPPVEQYMGHWILKLPPTLDTSLFTNTSSTPLNYSQNQFYMEKQGGENITITDTTITLTHPQIILEHPTIEFEKTIIDNTSIDAVVRLSVEGNGYAGEPHNITWTTYPQTPLNGSIALYYNDKQFYIGRLNDTVTWKPLRVGNYSLLVRVALSTPVTTTKTRVIYLDIRPRPVSIDAEILALNTINTTHTHIQLNITVKDRLNNSLVKTGYIIIKAYKNKVKTHEVMLPITSNPLILDLVIDPTTIEINYYDPALVYSNTTTTLPLTIQNTIPAPQPWILPILLSITILTLITTKQFSKKH